MANTRLGQRVRHMRSVTSAESGLAIAGEANWLQLLLTAVAPAFHLKLLAHGWQRNDHDPNPHKAQIPSIHIITSRSTTLLSKTAKATRLGITYPRRTRRDESGLCAVARPRACRLLPLPAAVRSSDMPALLRLVSRPTTAGHLRISLQPAATKGAAILPPALSGCRRRRTASNSFVTAVAVPPLAASTPLLPNTITAFSPTTALRHSYFHSSTTRTMASATSFYDFKPLDSESLIAICSRPLVYSAVKMMLLLLPRASHSRRLVRPSFPDTAPATLHVVSQTALHHLHPRPAAAKPALRSAPTTPRPALSAHFIIATDRNSAFPNRLHNPHKTQEKKRLTADPSPQRRANPTTSPPSKAKSSLSSTPLASAASPRNSAASRPSTRKSSPSTRTTSSSSVSPATSSATRTRAPTTRSSPSARSTTACPSPCWAKSMSMATRRTRCGSG